MTSIEIMNLPAVCMSFPRLTSNNINRDHILNGIEMCLDSGTDLLFVEGNDGIGKTTVMAQYALKHPLNTFSIFIRSTSRWAYDPEILLRDLANQITWLLSKKEIPPEQEIDRSFLRSRFLTLQRKAQSWNETYIFIIDGMEEVPKDSSDICEQILDLLPFGFSGFKFILTGDKNKLPPKYFTKIKSRSFPLVPFSLDEAKNFLSNSVDDISLGEIYKTCKGIPEYLTAIKRVIEGGTDIQTLINDLPEKLPDLFEIEWNKIDFKNDKLIDALAILAHDRKKHSIQNLARVLHVSLEDIAKDLSDTRVIVIERDGEVNFVSEPYRKFAIKQLSTLKKRTIDLLIDDLLKNSTTQDALLLLPGYFNEAERYDDLLNFLSPDYFSRIIECSGTMIPLRQQATLGVDISKQEGRDIDMLRFSTEKSIILGTDRARALISEIEALMALGDHEKALSLAQSAILKEDLLQSLAVLAKKKLEKNNKIELELINQIRQTYNQIDPEMLGERGLEIASDLVFSVPDIAIELVEKTYSDNSEEKVIDWAVAKLSVAAAAAGNQNGTDVYEQIRQKINNPKTYNITTVATLILGDYDADQVIEESEKFSNPLDGLFMLRLWTTQKREREDAAKVINYAIKLSIRTSEYTPNARDFRELASPLPYVKDKQIIKELITQFDALKGTLIKFGPSEDFVRLQIILAQAERQVDIQASYNRILENYLYFINDLEDLSIKASCIARIFVALDKIDPDRELEDQDKFHSLVTSDFEKSLTMLLSSTAEHYKVSKPIINALAKKKPLLAFDIAKKLNLESRRNHAYYDIINSHINQPHKKWDFMLLSSVLSALTDVEFQDDALLNIFARLTFSSEEDAKVQIKDVLPFIELIDHIETASIKCNTFGLIYSYLAKVEDSAYDGIKEMINKKIHSSWEAIDNGWTKVDFGFRTAEILSPISIEYGRQFYQETELLKRDMELSENTGVNIYISCLNLAIRAFTGLLKRNIDAPEDLEQLQFAIDKLPSTNQRIRAWGDIAAGFIINNRIDDAKKIVSEFIRPNLNLLCGSEKNYRSHLIIYLAPVLFSTNQISSYEEISNLKIQQKDAALAEICKFIFKKTLLSDPYDYTSGKGFDVTYDDVVVILDLLNRMKTDGAIFVQIELLADSLTAPKGKDRITKEQRIEIGRRLEKIIDEIFPDKRNITHDGYKIAARSQVYRIISPNPQAWNDLIQQTKVLPNISDQAYVLGIIASSMPSKMFDKRKAVLSEACVLIDKIPALLDRIERCEALAKLSVDIDQEISKKLLNQGIKAAITRDEPEAFSAQRSLIDFAYSTIGSDFATNLASLADDDPARKRAQQNLTERIKLQEIKHEVIDPKGNSRSEVAAEKDFPRVAWMLLSALNADRIQTFHLDEMRPFIENASVLPIQKSYPIFAWVVQNAIKRFSHTDQARTTIKSMFSALMTATELSGRISKCSTDHIRLAGSQSLKNRDDNSIVIRAGERDKALALISNWLGNDVQDYIKISDPYFSLPDLELLLLVMEIKPSCKVFILTSRKQQEQDNIQVPWEQAFRLFWKRNLSDQYPPECDIVIVGAEKTGEHPIHDRWWVTNGSGYRMGTSYKSLGVGKDTELSKLTPGEAQIREAEIDRFLVRRIREHDGERLAYILLSL